MVHNLERTEPGVKKNLHLTWPSGTAMTTQ